MQKTKIFPLETSNRRISDYLLVFSFLLIASILFAVNAFPALYGDEYGSLTEAQHLEQNIHAIGYFFQLHFWSSISNSDRFLRVLSILWFGAGLYWLNAWLKDEQISSQTRTLVVWLALLNPFLWLYGFQIRFYAMFFSASIFFVWRFRAWQKLSSPRSSIFLVVSGLLLLSSHLFGALILVTSFLHYLWMRFTSRGKRWIFLSILAIGSSLILLPPVRSLVIWIVYRMSNPYANIPDPSARGISLGMLGKVPLTFYFFMLGERVYPLWWWVVVPAMLVMGVAFLLGLWQLRRLPGLGTLVVLMLLNVPLMFLVLDPLAPPGLQGAAPRYVIFVIPYFILLIALGAQAWKPLKPALIIVSLVGLYFLARPIWSFGGGDFTNWPRYLNNAVVQPKQACIVTDGRAEASVNRYAPPGVKIVRDNVQGCLGFSRIILVSDDFRLSMVRYFDELSKNISNDYTLVSNMTLFPAQITIYEKTTALKIQFLPGRLDLPEQDLRFPIVLSKRGWKINGFIRLDDKTPTVTIPIPGGGFNPLWILTNYRVENDPNSGAPVFSLRFTGVAEIRDNEIILRAGEETAAWQGPCISCVSIYDWTKLFHLLGSYSYSGAYRQYQSHVWGFSPDLIAPEQYTSVTITFLLPNGTGYFWGIFPETR